MKYDFSTYIDRTGKDAIAFDGVGQGSAAAPKAPKEGFDIIPMWIADMNFATVPSIPEAMIERAKHALYGYFPATEEYYDAIINWQKSRNQAETLTKEHISYENGALGGVISALNVLCSKGDHILVHSPTYLGFTAAVNNNGYRFIHSELLVDDNGEYQMDVEDMERKIVDHKIHVLLFCSPHNPTGRVWKRHELEQMMELCKKHDVYVISDELWSDILLDGNQFLPTQSVSEDAKQRTVAIYAPSKTFNLAGLIGSYRIVYNQWLKDRIDKESSLSHYNEMNVMSMHALIGAYQAEGHEWVDELCQVLSENMNYAYDYVKEHFDGVNVSKPEATYLLYLDCTEWCKANQTTLDELLKAGWDVGVGWQDGRLFRGSCHIRMNLALPTEKVKEAFERLAKHVFN